MKYKLTRAPHVQDKGIVKFALNSKLHFVASFQSATGLWVGETNSDELAQAASRYGWTVSQKTYLKEEGSVSQSQDGEIEKLLEGTVDEIKQALRSGFYDTRLEDIKRAEHEGKRRKSVRLAVLRREQIV